MRKLIIIGSGPAGLTAAIYGARADMQPLVFEGPEPGGQLTTTTDVENFPGFVDGIMGPDMMDIFRKQAQRFGAECEYGTVTKVDFSSRPFKLWIDEDRMEEAETVIISTGASAKYLGLESEKALLGHGVSACATCDGFFFRDKEVVVVGGGDSAMEEATFLTKFCSKVTIIHRRTEFRASKIMAQRALNNPKISVEWNSGVTEVLTETGQEVIGVRLKDTNTGEERVLDCEGMFLGIGHTPNTKVFKGQLDMDDKGYLLVDGTKTNIPGVFAAGDVADKEYRQAITAAGMGCAALLDAERWLSDQED
ncbi:MAG: thioredoxin reductase (NADPH) [Myxococcota bacterium]|jgi:thioredoxin reductase (NADPH)